MVQLVVMVQVSLVVVASSMLVLLMVATLVASSMLALLMVATPAVTLAVTLVLPLRLGRHVPQFLDQFRLRRLSKTAQCQ